MLWGALRGDRAHVVRMLVGLAILAAGVVVAVLAIGSLADSEPLVAGVVTIVGGTAVTLGFAVAPLVLGAVDPLDPRRFGVLGLSPGPLAAALAGAGLVSLPGFVLLVLGASVVTMWAAQSSPVGLAVLSVALGIVTCILLARVSEAVGALVMRERRSRELAGLFLVAVLVVVVPVVVFVSSVEWRGAVPLQVREVVDILALTPFGAAWALPAADGGAFAGRLVIALATLVLLAAAWAALVRRILTRTERPVAVRERGGLGWFAVAPGTPGGAIAARSLVYWFRDRRYLVNIVIVPIAAAVTVVPLLVVGVPPEVVALVPVPIVALFLGWLPHNDLAYDSTAVWMHIASGVRGMSDRLGRLVPILLVGVPVLAIAVPIAIAFQGRWALLPALAGVCTSLFLCGLGLSSISSALAPYPVSRPGDSPFQQPQRSGSGGVVAQGLVMLGAIVLSAPALWWGWLAVTRDVSFASSALWAGIGGGVVVLSLGVAVGAAVFRRSGNRLMEFAEAS